MQTPITVAHHNYIDRIVAATNESGLPAFIKVSVLEKVIQELRPMVDSEYHRDLLSYKQTKDKEE